jgi:two-component system response regulator
MAADILLVEDNPDYVDLILHLFRELGVADRVHVARDGAEALTLLTGDAPAVNPKVILLDVTLPRIGGLDVLARLKADRRTQPIPVVMMSAADGGPEVMESYRLGANSFLLKPVDFDALRRTVGRAVAYWTGVNVTAPQASA